jgi:hypothetical protein
MFGQDHRGMGRGEIEIVDVDGSGDQARASLVLDFSLGFQISRLFCIRKFAKHAEKIRL